MTPHESVDVGEEGLVARAEVVEAGVAVGCEGEAVLGALAVACEPHVALAAVAGQGVALGVAERTLLR